MKTINILLDEYYMQQNGLWQERDENRKEKR